MKNIEGGVTLKANHSRPSAARVTGHWRRGFTLIELLVVIGIISVLLSILLPAFAKVQDTVHEVQCQRNLRVLIGAFQAFSADNNQTMPGCIYECRTPYPNPVFRDWLQGADSVWQDAPQTGTIYPYVKNPSMYLCPSLVSMSNGGVNGFTSNGHFDYSFFLAFDGARLATIPGLCLYTHPAGTPRAGLAETLATPIIVEEYPNHIDGATATIEGTHGSSDQLAHTHRNGGFYASVDGAVHWFNEDFPLGGGLNWTIRAPSGATVKLGVATSSPLDVNHWMFGWWNHQ